MDDSDCGSLAPDVPKNGAESEQPSSKQLKPEKPSKKSDKKSSKGGLKNYWVIKATVITFFLSAFFGFLSELTATTGNIIVTFILLFFLVACGVLFDGIGVSVAACELSPLLSMASKKVPGSRTAIKLVKNAEVVSNICNDVIGDCCGILSGSCAAVLVASIVLKLPDVNQKIIAIAISSIVSALTVGGKAYLKTVAIHRSKDFIMLTARIMSVFFKEKR